MKYLTLAFVSITWLAASAFAGDAMMPIFKTYDQIRIALAEDSLEGAQKAANDLEKIAKALETKDMDAELKSVWTKNNGPLMEGLGNAQKAGDIEKFRASFGAISNAMVALAAVAKPDGFHQFHCPMALDHKGGDWLQSNDEIANPYFGAKMIHCGYKVKEGSQ